RRELILRLVVTLRDRTIFQALMVQFRHPMRQIFLFLLQSAKRIKDGHALGEHRAARKIDAILRKVAGDNALCGIDRPIVERLNLRQNLQQRRLPRTIRADNTNALLRRNQPIEIFKKNAGAEAFPGFGKLNHGELREDLQVNYKRARLSLPATQFSETMGEEIWQPSILKLNSRPTAGSQCPRNWRRKFPRAKQFR